MKKSAQQSAEPAKATAAASRTDSVREPSVRWTFLTNHSHVLILLAEDPSMTLRVVAARIGITERAVQRIIMELEEEGFLKRERVGRQNHYQINYERPLRHEIERHRTIGDLLNLINSDRDQP